ncbi:MAG: hypothetical protein BJ554DRAFT_7301 [Olpidium bornovanus]|uniref:Uncharacterized protein n=1 Tax=Olpidium bornovanus TaxID=278681 RepID=A0A8H8DM80_9FUNG|nr:MAG: hypothetical protein BJ554DRAFT_7301 [Olpidium bornovanus]
MGQIAEKVIKNPTRFRIDNMGAAELASGSRASSRSKHIDIRYRHLRRCAADKIIQIERVASEENPADILTKALDKEKFAKFGDMIGVGPVGAISRPGGQETTAK